MKSYKVLSILITILLFSLQSSFVSAQPYKTYPRGGTLVIHNNTDATLTIMVLNGGGINEVEVPPISKLELRRGLYRGENQVSAMAERVRPAISNITKTFWVSGSARKIHEWSIYPKDFGKSFLADAMEREEIESNQGCNDLSGAWYQQSGKSGSSTWNLTQSGGSSYQAREEGLGKAVGTAVYNGKTLKINWKTGAWSGYYEWPLGENCVGGNGTLVFLTGGKAGKTETSNVERRSTIR